VLASVQDAQVQAAQALVALATVMARSSPACHPPALPTTAASEFLACLERAVVPLVGAANGRGDKEVLREASGLESEAAEYKIATQTAQVLTPTWA